MIWWKADNTIYSMRKITDGLWGEQQYNDERLCCNYKIEVTLKRISLGINVTEGYT